MKLHLALLTLLLSLLIANSIISMMPAVKANPDDTSSLIYYLTNMVANTNFSQILTSDYSYGALEVPYYGYTMGNKTSADLQTYYNDLPVTNWNEAGGFIRTTAYFEKFGITNATLMRYALGNLTMMNNGLPAYNESGTTAVYHNSHRYLIRGFKYAEDLADSSLLAKWNKTIAFNSFYTIVNSTAYKEFLYVDNSNTTTSNHRYYDEFAETIGTFLEFYKLGLTDALNAAITTWNNVNTHRWDDTYQYYHYNVEPTPPSNVEWETEGGSFLEIITQLYYYSRDIPNATRLVTDITNRYIASDWSAPQFTYTGTKYYVALHKNTGNTQRRLPGTVHAWTAILGLYSELNSTMQTVVRTMLEGSSGYDPAWKLLFNSTHGLYGGAWGFRPFSDDVVQNRANGMATALAFMLGIVPQTGSLAIPLEEVSYEYLFNVFDGDLYRIDLNARTVKLSIIQPGTIKFLWNASVTQNFNETGIWNVSFASDWNSIVSAERTAPLPTNRKYLPGGLDITADTSSNVIGASFYIDGTVYTTPDSRLVSGQTHNFTATASYENATGTYTFTHWLVAGTYIYTTLTITPYIADNTTFYINYNPPAPPPPPPSELPTMYYMRTDTHTVNTETHNKLIYNDNTDTMTEVNTSDVSATGPLTYQIGYRVSLVHINGYETELTTGSPIGVMTRASGTEYTNETWDVPYSILQIGQDALKVTVYVRLGVGDWLPRAAFITLVLSYKAINATTWTFSVWNTYTYDAATNTTTATLRWDSDTYLSGIYGIAFTNPNPYEDMLALGIGGNFIGFILYPFTSTMGNLFYGILVLIICMSTYIRAKSVIPVLIMWILFGGAGGIFTLLVGNLAAGLIWIVMLFTLSGLLYKVFR